MGASRCSLPAARFPTRPPPSCAPHRRTGARHCPPLSAARAPHPHDHYSRFQPNFLTDSRGSLARETPKQSMLQHTGPLLPEAACQRASAPTYRSLRESHASMCVFKAYVRSPCAGAHHGTRARARAWQESRSRRLGPVSCLCIPPWHTAWALKRHEVGPRAPGRHARTHARRRVGRWADGRVGGQAVGQIGRPADRLLKDKSAHATWQQQERP